MSCGNCGEFTNRQNPLDCNSNSFLSCNNPCGTGPGNSASCESLPSQIENFTLQFFGTVVKTEVNGVVTWSLPCSLDVGLPNNPRGIDEGLACYFLRLFHDGIVGLTGPPGAPGANGANGNNAYSVTLRSFVQPSFGSPIVQVVTQFNPAILNGTYIFIAGSGWYLVNENDGNGVLLLTLVRALDGASGTITAGKLAVPSGFPGASIQGPQGLQGPKGDQGPAGTAPTDVNGFYYATVGTDFTLDVTYQPVNFVNSSPEVLLPEAGKYLVTVSAAVQGLTGVVTSQNTWLKLYNTTVAASIPGTEFQSSGYSSNTRTVVSFTSLVMTDSPNQTIWLFAKCDFVGHFSIVALQTTITFVKVQ
jgi:hypothetical protein